MRRFFVICFLMLAGGLAGLGQEPTLDVSRTTLYEGESVVLTIRVPGGDDGVSVDVSALPDLRATLIRREVQNWSNISINNGRMQRDGFNGLLVEYSLQPLKKGSYPAGAVTVSNRGKTWILGFPSLQVLDIPKQDGAALELKAEPDVVLLDEPFTVTLTMRIKRLPPPYDEIPPFVPESPPQLTLPFLDEPLDGIEKPDLRALLQSWINQGQRSGFRINGYTIERSPFEMGSLFDDMGGNPFGPRPARFLPPSRPIEVDGALFNEYNLSIPFTARDEGSYTFGPSTLNGQILTGVDKARRGLSREFSAVARAAIVRVVPPPAEGRPASFFGLIGTNLVVDAQLNAGTCRVGDPLKVTLRIKGQLNWRHARLPDLSPVTNQPSLFHVYASTLQSSKTDEGREFTFTLRPLQPGTFEIPPIAVSWFDAGSRTYKTASSIPIPLRVEPSSELSAGNWAPPAPDETAATEDSHQTIASALRYDTETLPSSRLPIPLLLLLAAGPVLMVITLTGLFVKRLWVGRQNNRRRHRALPLALKRIRDIPVAADNRQKAIQGCALMRDFAADLADCDPGGLTPPDWRRLLLEKGTPPPLAGEFESTMTALFEAAYNPARQQPDLSGLLSLLPDLLRRLDHQTASSSARPVMTKTLLMISLSLAGLTANADDFPSGRQFEWEEVRSLSMQASTPDEFRQAAILYNRLVTDGVRNGECFYNLGTCLLLAGDAEKAWRSFVRAERYLGRPSDLVRNMNLARASMKDGENSISTWDRTLLFLHFGVPLSIRLWVVAGAFFLFCLVCAARFARNRSEVISVLFMITLAVLIASGSSVAVTLVQEAAEEPLVISQHGGSDDAR
jgi:hypothetical protein